MNTLKTGCPASESDSAPPAYLQLHSRHSSHSQVCPEALSHAVLSFRDRKSFKFSLFCSDAWSAPKILQLSCIESSPETVAGRTEVNSQGVAARLAKQERRFRWWLDEKKKKKNEARSGLCRCWNTERASTSLLCLFGGRPPVVIMETFAEWIHPYLTSSSLIYFTAKFSLPDQSFKSTNKLNN